MSENVADIGVFGGSGFHSFLDNVKEITVDTPFGSPSVEGKLNSPSKPGLG